jgi:hypothetical protein
MQAFPKDSLNNVIGGSGPLNARPDHATFMGHAEDEAFKEFAKQAPVDKSSSSAAGTMGVFDPLSRGSVLHGEESLGLGTSTFLEGTPAARTAVQRREAEQRADAVDNGLQRKKSLAQRIRSINRGPREFAPSGRMTNPEGAYARRSPPVDMPTPGSHAATAQPTERNPFFAEFDTKKGDEVITVRRADTLGPKSPASPPLPGAQLERRATADAARSSSPDEGTQSKQSGGGGLLARVKSLKGAGRRTKPEVPAGAAPPPPPGKD